MVTASCGGVAGDSDVRAAPAIPVIEEGTPERGGQVTYGLEAETSDGFCLPEAQLTISGMMVARSVYDTLTAPNADGEHVPYLAESVEPNETFDEWTITLRDGVRFHDGTDLTAEVVKNNLDAYRGAYPARSPLLFTFVFDNIADVEVVDPLTVSVTTKTPWPALPAHLYFSGRVGIMAQAQLDDPVSCDRAMIGTGPFALQEWEPNDHLRAVRHDDYWQLGADGEPLPYLDEIEFRPIYEGAQRLNAIQAGEVDVMHTSGELQIGQLRAFTDAGLLNLVESAQYGEVRYLLLNTSRPPFDDVRARRALASALDRQTINEIRGNGILAVAEGPFAPGTTAYSEDTGFPSYDLDAAQTLRQDYEAATGQPLSFTVLSVTEPDVVQTAQLVQHMGEEAGASVALRQTELSQMINEAIAGDFQAMLLRQHPGADPDTEYVWWRSGSPVNFGRIDDPEIDRLLDEGRASADPDQRVDTYRALGRQFADQVYNIWLSHSVWGIATAPDVHGVIGPPLPDDGGDPFPGLGAGHPVSALWVEQ
jgi:peptide/nickel transport system substrate-binding protein